MSDICNHKRPLVHCHLHTSYSSLDGCGRVEDYIRIAKDNNHPAIAITDHGNPAGLFEFHKKLVAAGIKPILGNEFYITTDINEKIPNRKREVESRDKHQTIMIQNQEGYVNFNKLTYLAFTEGFYFKPRITFDMLFENKKGLIVSSGCMASMFSQLLFAGKEADAEYWFKKFRDELGDNFYGEIQMNEINDVQLFSVSQKLTNDFIIKMCKKYNVPVILAGDVHYAHQGDHALQNIVINVAQGKSNGEESFIHAKHLYYQTSEDFQYLNKEFGYNYDPKFLNEAMDNTIVLADSVDFNFDTQSNNYPVYDYPKTQANSSAQYLTDLCNTGLYGLLKERKKAGEVFTKTQLRIYQERLDMELKVIIDKQYEDYFLVYWDIVNWCNQQQIRIGPGRGSAAGALTAYALGICSIDPIEHELLFERFLNPYRDASPDIDSDFEQGSREKIRIYLEQQYGKDCVLGVGTHLLYHPKSALQDASRGLGKDTSFMSTLNTEITKLPGLDESKDLVEFFEKTLDKPISAAGHQWIMDNQETIKWANKLLTQCKNISTHAGGIVVTPKPVWNYIPVTRGSKEVVTAFRESDGSEKALSELGVLKLDILGLKTLNVVEGCCKQIQIDLGIDIRNDIKFVDLKDQRVISLLKNGNIYGAFQLDGGARKLVSMIRPDDFNDVVAINALNRPGPLETFGPVYSIWKQNYKAGKPQLCEDHPAFPKLSFMREVLDVTYGCLIKGEPVYNTETGCYDKIEDCKNIQVQSWSDENKTYSQQSVTKVIFTGNKEVYSYKLSAGIVLNCTKDHKILTPYGEIPIEEAFENKLPIAITKKMLVNERATDIIEEKKYRILGLLLGDGSIKSSNIYFTNTNQILIEDFTSLIKEVFPRCNTHLSLHKRDKYNNVTRVNVTKKSDEYESNIRLNYTANDLTNDLRLWGLHGKGSYNKFIPKSVFAANKQSKLSLLSGLWDSDGSVRNNGDAVYGTKSEQLANDIFTIIRQLGYLPYLTKTKENSYLVFVPYDCYLEFEPLIKSVEKKKIGLIKSYKNTKNVFPSHYYRTNVKLQTKESFWKYCKKNKLNYNLLRKKENIIWENTNIKDSYICDLYAENYFVQIKEKTKIGIREVYDLSINPQNPWFIGNQGVLVHNCLIFQEQFMLMVVKAGGFNLGEADMFRRCIAWKKDHPKYYVVQQYFDKLHDRMLELGYSGSDVQYFVEYCKQFMGYSFNKCLTQNHTVRTKEGVKNLLQVDLGEEILGYNPISLVDEWVEVETIHDNGLKEVFEITLESGKKIECTMDHKFQTQKGMLPLSQIIKEKLSIKTKF